MKLQVFVAKNGFLGCTGQPKFDDHEADVFAKSFERHLLSGTDEQVFQFENVTWYHLGTYDDESMEFDAFAEPIMILECNRVLDQRKIKAKLLEASRKVEVAKEGDSDDKE